jgi:hypothetical protein
MIISRHSAELPQGTAAHDRLLSEYHIGTLASMTGISGACINLKFPENDRSR